MFMPGSERLEGKPGSVKKA